MKDTWVQFLGGEDPLEEEMATHSSILAWKMPQTEEPEVMKSWTQLSARTHTLYQYCFIMTDVPQWCMVLTIETIACGLYDNCLYYPHKLFVNLKLY